ncbi:threonine/serine exporter family protein [Arcobacteraceae bacterium]|nr:threonine/serine exporter family protein [Arcobacteraceae bacterium]
MQEQLSYEEQHKITKTIIKASVLMLEFGAESKLIELTANRLGKALGVDSVEMSLIPSAIVLSTLANSKTQSVTTTRMAHHKPINMSIVCDIQKMCYSVEKHKYNINYVIETLKNIKPNYYNRWLVVFMVGLSCASFAYLNNSDWQGLGITFLASAIAMITRQELAKRKFALIITFMVTAFVATLIAALSQIYELSSTPNIVLSSSVILLAPGFPFINSVLDAVKGYLAMGWGRWMQAVMLTVSTAIGITLAFVVLNLKGW